MEARTIITALGEIVSTLGAQSLVASAPDNPLALPEPPTPDQVTAYEAHIRAITASVDPAYHPLLTMSLRDYQAGYADRAGAYLIDFLGKLKEEPDYVQNLSPASHKQVEFYLADLREL